MASTHSRHITPRAAVTASTKPLHFAHAAAAELLKWLGFRDVVREGEKVTSVRSDDVPGFLLTRTADKYGRCVALIGRGDTPVASGNELRVDRRLLRKTANHRLIVAGLAYPTFYSKLYVDLRQELTKQASAARQGSGKGLFAQDATQNGVKVTALSSLTDQAIILPKLFRRLVDYLHLNGDNPSLAAFKPYLAQRDDRLYIISAAQKTGLDTIIDVTGQVVKLTHEPEDLIFDEE